MSKIKVWGKIIEPESHKGEEVLVEAGLKLSDKQTKEIVDYIYEWGFTFGSYYHTAQPLVRAKEKIDTPDEFMEKFLNKNNL